MSFQSREDMRPGATPVASPLASLQQQWAGLEGKGPQQMKLEGGGIVDALAQVMQRAAEERAQKYGVDPDALKARMAELNGASIMGDGPNAAR